MRKILLTGADGYIGKHVLCELVKRGECVTAITGRPPICVYPEVKYCTLDIFNQAEMQKLLVFPYDLCIHLAWNNGFEHNNPSHMENLSSHFCFIENLLKMGIKHIAVMGSMHEIGYFEGEVNENTIENPVSLYGIAKTFLRKSLTLYIQKYFPQTVFQWLRGYYLLGDDRRNHSVFTKMLLMAEKGERVFPFTSGKHAFDFLEIDELARQITDVTAQSAVTGIIECCSGYATPIGDVAEDFIRKNSLDIKLEYGAFPEPIYESSAVWGSIKKLNKAREVLLAQNI